MNVFVSVLILVMCMCTTAFASAEAGAPIWHQGTLFLLQALAFVITIICLKKWLFLPVSNLLEQRQYEIEKEYTEAERDSADAKRLKDDYEKRMLECEGEIREKISAAVKDGQKIADRTIADANLEIERRKKMAETEILREKEKAVEEIKLVAVDLGLVVASKIISEDLTDEKHRALALDFAKQLEHGK